MNKDKYESDKQIQKLYFLNGAIPSPIDHRDYTLSTVAYAPSLLELPEEYRLHYKGKILNQSSYGSCVPHALASALYYGEAKNNYIKHDFSRGFIYGNREDDQYQGEGMIVREALKQLNHYGDCLYKYFPYNNTYSFCKNEIQKDEKNLKEKAKPYTIINYFKLLSDNEIKQALLNYGSVIAAIELFDNFCSEAEIPTENNKSIGYHAMCLIGWDKTGWIFQNSWSERWGDNGCCHIPYNYPITECWGIYVKGITYLDYIISFIFKIIYKIKNK